MLSYALDQITTNDYWTFFNDPNRNFSWYLCEIFGWIKTKNFGIKTVIPLLRCPVLPKPGYGKRLRFPSIIQTYRKIKRSVIGTFLKTSTMHIVQKLNIVVLKSMISIMVRFNQIVSNLMPHEYWVQKYKNFINFFQFVQTFVFRSNMVIVGYD